MSDSPLPENQDASNIHPAPTAVLQNLAVLGAGRGHQRLTGSRDLGQIHAIIDAEAERRRSVDSQQSISLNQHAQAESGTPQVTALDHHAEVIDPSSPTTQDDDAASSLHQHEVKDVGSSSSPPTS